MFLSDELENFTQEYNINLLHAVYETVTGFPTSEISVCYENHTGQIVIVNKILFSYKSFSYRCNIYA